MAMQDNEFQKIINFFENQQMGTGWGAYPASELTDRYRRLIVHCCQSREMMMGFDDGQFVGGRFGDARFQVVSDELGLGEAGEIVDLVSTD